MASEPALFSRLVQASRRGVARLHPPRIRAAARGRRSAGGLLSALSRAGLSVSDPFRPRLGPGGLQIRYAGRDAPRASAGGRDARCRDRPAHRILPRLGPLGSGDGGRARGAGDDRLYPLRARSRPRRRPARPRSGARAVHRRLCGDRARSAWPTQHPARRQPYREWLEMYAGAEYQEPRATRPRRRSTSSSPAAAARAASRPSPPTSPPRPGSKPISGRSDSTRGRDPCRSTPNSPPCSQVKVGSLT